MKDHSLFGDLTEDPHPPRRVFRSGLSHEVLRYWQDPAVGAITAENLVYPIFISDSENEFEHLEELPGQHRLVRGQSLPLNR